MHRRSAVAPAEVPDRHGADGTPSAFRATIVASTVVVSSIVVSSIVASAQSRSSSPHSHEVEVNAATAAKGC